MSCEGKSFDLLLDQFKLTGQLKSSSTYCEALGLAVTLPGEEKGMTTSQKVSFRVGTLERAAMAAYSYGVIQYARVGFLLLP